jgi:hypothetical protein
MRTYFERMARTPTWIVGLAICSLAVLAISAMVRSIPASYADIPKQSIPSKPPGPFGSDGAGVIDAKANVALVRDTIHRRNLTSCRECGVVISMRQRVNDPGAGIDPVEAQLAGRIPVGAPHATGTSAVTATSYEIAVRFQDGSTIVLNEASPRNWRTGTRVIVVTGPNGSNSRP